MKVNPTEMTEMLADIRTARNEARSAEITAASAVARLRDIEKRLSLMIINGAEPATCDREEVRGA